MGRSQMITIIEGADATGKTTMAKYLASKTNATYLHASHPTSSNYIDEYIKPINSLNMVLDRWHIGEVIWPTIYNRESLFTEEDFDLCNWELATLGVNLIVLVRHEDKIVDELLRRGEEKEVDIVLHAQELFMQTFKQIKYLNKKLIQSEVLF